MKLGLVIHTCSNEHVAQAAVLSIGGELAASVAVEAARRGSSVGKYVARGLWTSSSARICSSMAFHRKLAIAPAPQPKPGVQPSSTVAQDRNAHDV